MDVTRCGGIHMSTPVSIKRTTYMRPHELRWADVPNWTLDMFEKFLDRIKSMDDCWEWGGNITKTGYGRMASNSAHVLSYKVANGAIPDGKHIDHLCKNRACVNPEHMELVSLVENVLRGDGPTAKNKRKTHCKRGHFFDDSNTIRPANRPHQRHCKACTLANQRKRYWNKHNGI